MNSTEMLEQIKLTWTMGRSNYRDACIQVGQMIRQYIIQCLKEVDGLNEHQRIRHGLSTRRSIIKSVSMTIKITPYRVNDLVRVSVVNELLCQPTGLELGSVSYSSMRSMRLLVCRVNKGEKIRRNKKVKKDNEIEPSETEVWGIRPSVVDTAPVLVKKAIQEQLSDKQVQQEVYSLLRKAQGGTGKRINSTATGTYAVREPKEEISEPEDLFDSIANTDDGLRISSIPVDKESLEERILTLCLSADDPDSLLEQVKERLQLIRSGRVSKMNVDDRETRLRLYAERADRKESLCG